MDGFSGMALGRAELFCAQYRIPEVFPQGTGTMLRVSPVPASPCLPAPGATKGAAPTGTGQAGPPRSSCSSAAHPRRADEEEGCPQVHLQTGGHSCVPWVTPVPTRLPGGKGAWQRLHGASQLPKCQSLRCSAETLVLLAGVAHVLRAGPWSCPAYSLLWPSAVGHAGRVSPPGPCLWLCGLGWDPLSPVPKATGHWGHLLPDLPPSLPPAPGAHS